jgi:hypothetical protein
MYLAHGDCRVPSFYTAKPAFGLCIEDMRKEYRDTCHKNSMAQGATSTCTDQNMGFFAEEGYVHFATQVEEENDDQISALPAKTLDSIIGHTSGVDVQEPYQSVLI